MNRLTELEEGDMIHLKQKRGTYTVVNVTSIGVYVSCKVWIARANYPDIIPTKFFEYSDIKCLAGGNYNRRVFKTSMLIV
jgi:hypothetical protein